MFIYRALTDIPMFVTPGLHYDVILGMSWLKKHQPKIE